MPNESSNTLTARLTTLWAFVWMVTCLTTGANGIPELTYTRNDVTSENCSSFEILTVQQAAYKLPVQ